MANNRFNKQVSPKGYADGGIIPKNFKDLKPGVIDTAKKIKKKKAPKTSIKEKILPNKKKKRLEELRESLK